VRAFLPHDRYRNRKQRAEVLLTVAMAKTTLQVNHMQKVVDQDLEEKLGQNALLQAKQATDDEHAQTLMQALRENRRAVFWSVMISMAIIMEGYVCPDFVSAFMSADS
jgi:translation initiation factor 2 alpha subunit (eIF-2alpha)